MLRVYARAAADTAWSDDGDPEDDRDARLERVAAGVAAGPHWRARAEYDLTHGNGGWRGAWVQYRFRQGLALRVGNQNTGFGLEDSAPDSSSPFMERPTSGSLAPGRLTGIMLEAWGDFYTLRAGVFGDRYLENLGDRRGSQGNGGVARLVLRPRGTMRDGIALGGTLEYRNVTDDDVLQLRARPESELIPIVDGADTGLVEGATRMMNAGLEAAWTAGPAILAGEVIALTVDRAAAPSLHPWSWNAWGTWIVTGQRRTYRNSSASFVEVPVKWPGALELAVRATGADLDTGGVQGGLQRNSSAAINWYPRTGVRLMLEYARHAARHAGIDKRADGLLQLRFQLEYGVGAE